VRELDDTRRLVGCDHPAGVGKLAGLGKPAGVGTRESDDETGSLSRAEAREIDRRAIEDSGITGPAAACRQLDRCGVSG
jgi:hypothetical protein